MSSTMLQEAVSAHQYVELQLASDGAQYAELGRRLRAMPPSCTLTVARGSSDHAANYCAYLIMARLGHVVASLPMSLVTLYQAPLQARNMLAIAISQSGRSPDLVQTMAALRAGGANTIALVNDADSPLAHAVESVLALHAGPEHCIAATKSVLCSLTAAARLVGHWQNDPALLGALAALPEALLEACRSDWSRAIDVLAPARSIMVVGRGIGFPIALEAALKLKETSALQAEAFSGAEIQHGPMALIEADYPLLMFATRGPAQAGMRELARTMRERGACVLLAAPSDVPERDLPLPVAATPELDPIVALQAFYVMAAHLSIARGMDPDHPRHLSKITSTL